MVKLTVYLEKKLMIRDNQVINLLIVTNYGPALMLCVIDKKLFELLINSDYTD